MKKLAYVLQSIATGEKWEYSSIKELFEDPKNDWLKVSLHTVSKIPKNTTYENKVCRISKLETELVKTIFTPPKRIYKIKDDESN